MTGVIVEPGPSQCDRLTPDSFCRKGLAASGPAALCSLSWSFSKREQRRVVSEGEYAALCGRWRAGLADKVWVESQAAARGKGARIPVEAEARLLDVQLAVLQE